MANSIYQGKIIRQFWGKLIRQSTYTNTRLQFVTWGGCLNYQNGSLDTFFHCGLKE